MVVAQAPNNPPNPKVPSLSTPPLTLTVGEVTFGSDQSARYTSPPGDGDADVFTDYRVVNSYEWDPHTYTAGVTSPVGFNGQSAAFFCLASPTLLWVCDWTAAKWNSEPNVPAPDVGDSNWILLMVMPEAVNVTVGPDGTTPLYRVSGQYVYGHRSPDANVYKNVNFPRPPWLEDSFTRTFDLSKLTQNLSTAGKSQGSQTVPLVNKP